MHGTHLSGSSVSLRFSAWDAVPSIGDGARAGKRTRKTRVCPGVNWSEQVTVRGPNAGTESYKRQDEACLRTPRREEKTISIWSPQVSLIVLDPRDEQNKPKRLQRQTPARWLVPKTDSGVVVTSASVATVGSWVSNTSYSGRQKDTASREKTRGSGKCEVRAKSSSRGSPG